MKDPVLVHRRDGTLVLREPRARPSALEVLGIVALALFLVFVLAVVPELITDLSFGGPRRRMTFGRKGLRQSTLERGRSRVIPYPALTAIVVEAGAKATKVSVEGESGARVLLGRWSRPEPAMDAVRAIVAQAAKAGAALPVRHEPSAL